jgi:phage tail protein X
VVKAQRPRQLYVRMPERDSRATFLVVHGLAAAAQVLDDGVEVTGIPRHDRVEDQAEGDKLVFLAFAVGLPDLAAVAGRSFGRGGGGIPAR